MRLLRELGRYRAFLKYYVLQQFRTRYRGSFLGFAWSLLLPFATLGTFSLVFAFINGVNMREFGPRFFGGFLAWTFFSGAVSGAVGSIVGNPQFVTRVYAPKAVFPVGALILSMVEFFAFAVSALVLLTLFGARFTPAVLFLPVAFLVFLPFVLGCCLLFAAGNVFLRDLGFVWTAASTLWFFLTPILYPLEVVPPVWRPYFLANPLLPFIQMFQLPVSAGSLPDGHTVGIAALYSAIVLIAGVAVFQRSERSFYLYI